MTRSATAVVRSHGIHASQAVADPRLQASLERLRESVVRRCACCIADAARAALAIGADRDLILDAMGGAMLVPACEGSCTCHAAASDV